MRSKRDGMPIPGSQGTITREQQEAALGIDKTEPKPAPLPLTPAQHRKLMSDEYPGEPPEDYEASTMSFAEAWGIESLPTPANYRDGDPLPQVPKPRTKPVGTDWSKLDAAKAKPAGRADATTVRAEVDQLFEAWRGHAARTREGAEAARGTDREAAAADAVKQTTEIGRQLKRMQEKLS